MTSTLWRLTCVGFKGRAFCTSLSLWCDVIWFNSHIAPTWMFVPGCNMTHNANMICYMIIQLWHWVAYKNIGMSILVECAGYLPAKQVQFVYVVWSLKGICSTSSAVLATTLDTLHPIYLLASFWTGRGRRGDGVYRKVFGKWAVGFWREGARRRLGGEGYLWVYLRHHARFFDTTGRRASERMCERGRHPLGWTLNPKFWQRDQTF